MKSLVWGFALLFFICIGTLCWQTGSAQQRPESTHPITSTPKMLVETLQVKSKRLAEDRQIEIYLPASYINSKQRYPVMYALDGEGTGSTTANAVQFMTGNSAIPQMPEAIVVGVTNTNRNRDMPVPREYGKGGEENFLAFLADELIPFIEQRYRTQPLRVLVGHSQGGLFAHFALSTRPNLFQWYLSMDAPLAGFPDVKHILEKAKTVITTTPNFRIRLVTIENLYGWKKEWQSLTAVAPKPFFGEQIEIKDETHETMVYKSIYEGLKRLFQDYAPNIIRDNKGDYTLPVLEQRYKGLSQAYGYQVDIPKPLLLISASRSVAMQYGAEAVELIKRAEALYGESPQTRRIMAEAEAATKQGRDPRLAEWEKLPPPDIEKIKPFLGTWEMIKKDGSRWFMTFEVKDGVVRAQNSVTPPGGESVQLEVQFVQIMDARTLRWGLRNGLGGGTILQTGKLVDETTLQGTSEPVGIPHAPPPSTVTYKRKVSSQKPSTNDLFEAATLEKKRLYLALKVC